jgi:hypothetical protein
MKTKNLLLVSLFLTLSLPGFAQTIISGVYKTYDDYTNQKITFGIDCKTEKHKIKLNEFPNKSFITVIHDGKPHQMAKDSVFGYQLCDGNFVRFVDNTDYHLTEKGDVWLYKKLIVKSPKGSPEPNLNFFSVAGEKPIVLTMENLKKAFPNNHKFHDALTAQFKNDAELAAFDSFHKKSKVNHLLEMSRD